MKTPRFAEPGDRDAVENGTRFMPAFDANGLITCVACDHLTGAVLMVAHMNEEAIAATLSTGEAHYWSRSRGELWRKGATSGATQKVVELRTDCDQDALVLLVEAPAGSATCHTGKSSCFYRRIVPPTGDAEVELVPVDAC